MTYEKLDILGKILLLRRIKRLGEAVGIRVTKGEIREIRVLAVKWHLSDAEIQRRIKAEREARKNGYLSVQHWERTAALRSGLRCSDYVDNRR